MYGLKYIQLQQYVKYSLNMKKILWVVKMETKENQLLQYVEIDRRYFFESLLQNHNNISLIGRY